MPKKFLGIVLLIISISLLVFLIVHFQSFYVVVAAFIGSWLNGGNDSYLERDLLWDLAFWIAHLTLMIIFWRLGRKWIRAKPIPKQGQ